MELKDEFKPNKETMAESFFRQIKQKYGDPVKTEWRVIEITDPYNDDDQYVGSKVVDGSQWFDAESEAEAYLSKVTAGYRNKLKIVSRTLYRKWVPAHWEEKWL